MNWRLPNDHSEAVITAKKHIASSHGGAAPIRLPETCVIFEMGMAIPCLEKHFSTVTLAERLPGFITDGKCVAVDGSPGVCFAQGGYGAPAAADTLETVLALGVRRVLMLGMCGGFSADIHVGDVVIPNLVFCEEGTSQHYLGPVEQVSPDGVLYKALTDCFSRRFSVLESPMVSTDAVYRQTMDKEAYWRSKSCVAVDMEASALLAVCQYYSVPAAAALFCSDRHPMPDANDGWRWGIGNFKEMRETFVLEGVSYILKNL